MRYARLRARVRKVRHVVSRAPTCAVPAITEEPAGVFIDLNEITIGVLLEMMQRQRRHREIPPLGIGAMD